LSTSNGIHGGNERARTPGEALSDAGATRFVLRGGL
jgi:hypothetical protein